MFGVMLHILGTTLTGGNPFKPKPPKPKKK